MTTHLPDDARTAPGPLADRRSIRVVFVDDHRMVADSLAAVVGDEPGIDVVGVAETLARAVELSLAVHPDVVIMDYRLPDGDGAEATRRLRQLDRPPQIVILTASGDDHVLRAALAAGCCGFLTKGGSIANLVEAIWAASAGESVFSPDVVRRLARVGQGATCAAETLTARELEVLGAVATGLSTSEIAGELVLSEHTVRNHIRNTLTKLGAHTKLEAVVIAARQGLISLSER